MEIELIDLINSKREGSFWDFKEVHHNNKASLLHDILSLSNSVTKSNKYLIFGVSDPSDDCQIKGVSSESRKSQTDIIDFLRSKPFAGENRPEVEMRTHRINNVEIDVLTIFDHPQKPYYLSKEYRDGKKVIRANHIYTRNLDTNTPIDQSADVHAVEKMWRERFGLDLKPSERMVDFLNRPDDWEKDLGNSNIAYHKYSPEYQIEFGETKSFKDVYSYFYINESSFIGTAYFKYLNTVLFSLPYVYCDEMRVQFPDVTNGNLKVGNRTIWYMYYILNSRAGAFLNFITAGRFDFESRGNFSAFVLYRDETERLEFEEYLSDRIDEFDKMVPSEIAKIYQKRVDASGEGFVFHPIEMAKVVELFKDWKIERDLAIIEDN